MKKQKKTKPNIENEEIKKESWFNKLKTKIYNYFLPKGIQLEMLRYRPNKGSYNLSLLAIILLALGFCVFYSSTNLPSSDAGFNLLGSSNAGPWLGVDIIINILIMLFLFFISVRLQSYSLQMGYASIVVGAFQVIRPYLLPLSLTVCGTMKGVIFTLILVFYTISGAFSIIAGFLSVYRGTALRKYLTTVAPIENEKVGK